MNAWRDGNSYLLTRWLFLRLLGAIYLIAFFSLLVQLDGLIGRHGLLPAADFLAFVQARLGPTAAFTRFPTLFWLNASDAALNLACVFGVVCALLLCVGLLSVPALLLLWLLYLSFVVVGQTFFGFQWDNLLLEVGLLALFFAPLGWRERWLGTGDQPPSAAVLWLFRWLLFRLMFTSGLVKLLSGDPTWRALTALSFHYETQPLPTWIGWYAHQLPLPFQQASTLVTLVIELAVPWLIFAPRRGRLLAFPPLATLQLLILLTGNYTFFNWLTLALCLLLLDDGVFGRPPQEAQPAHPRGREMATAALVIIVLCLSGLQMAGLFMRPPLAAQRLASYGAPFRSVNRYGLFAVMTTSRPEIILEGSLDGQTWRPYAFKWKPGDVAQRPRFVAPHQPRLDWQMWFAALGRYQDNPWLFNLMQGLLEGRPEVEALLAENPFPDAPPRYIRATLFDYRFTTLAERQATGAWWQRERLGPYAPTLAAP